MNRHLTIFTLLLTLTMYSCRNSSSVITVEVGDKLNAAADIAVEIEAEYALECDPFVRGEDGVAFIEFSDTDSNLDFDSIVPKISELESVQSFDGELHLLFRSAPSSSGAVENLGGYDAKTGQVLQP